MKKILIPIFFCFLAFLLLSFRITQVPPGINGDEAGIGYNAALISKNLTDETGNFLPLFIFAKSSDWKQPVTVYATATVFKILGISYFNLRVTSVLFVLVSILILYFISREFFNLKFFMVSSLFLVTTPIILIQSHLGLENIAPLPFVFLWLWMLLRHEKTGKNIFLVAAGASLGIGLFSYLGMRLVVPILTVVSFIYLLKSDRKFFYFLAGVLPFFLLLFWAYFHYPGAVFGNFNSPTVVSPYDFLYRYLSGFDLSFLFFTGDTTTYHSTGQFGMLLLMSLPLFLLGVYKTLKEKNKFLTMVLVSFFVTSLLFGFVPEIHRASRLIPILPFFIIVSTVGFLSLSKKVVLIALIFVAINYGFFANDYWFAYPNRVEKDFSPPISILRGLIKNGADSSYKYYSSIQFLKETNDEK